MADEAVPVAPMEVEPIAETSSDNPAPVEDPENGGAKRAREEDEEPEEKGEKRAKTDDEPEEKGEKRAKTDDEDQKNGGEEKESGPAAVGPKTFGSSVEMFDYFFKLLHGWTPNLNLNKYEQMVLAELLKKGHIEAEKKIGKGIKAFQVRYHPQFKSRCFFIIRRMNQLRTLASGSVSTTYYLCPKTCKSNMTSTRHCVERRRRGRGRGRGGK